MTNRIQILSSARMGSTYLHDLICLHTFSNPDLRYDGGEGKPQNGEFALNEPFFIHYPEKENIKDQNLINAMQYSLDCIQKSYSNCIVKNHINHLHSLKELRGDLYSRFFDTEWTTICLIRKNLFETSLSLAIGGMTNIWGDYPNNMKTVTIDPEYFKQCVNKIWNAQLRLINNALGIKYHQVIFYENLTGNIIDDYQSLIINNTCNTIDPKKARVKKSPKKSNLVKNYDNLYSIMSELRYNYHNGTIGLDYDFNIKIKEQDVKCQ